VEKLKEGREKIKIHVAFFFFSGLYLFFSLFFSEFFSFFFLVSFKYDDWVMVHGAGKTRTTVTSVKILPGSAGDVGGGEGAADEGGVIVIPRAGVQAGLVAEPELAPAAAAALRDGAQHLAL